MPSAKSPYQSGACGSRLVVGQKVYIGHHIELDHKLRGPISGWLVGYDGVTLRIRPAYGASEIWVNKGFVQRMHQAIAK
jgi:hypothetical protein